MIKRFEEWIKLKIHINNTDKVSMPFFKEGEIWWCSIGENIGSEINGKGLHFIRPIFIFKKYSKESFFGLPITSKYKTGDWYVQIEIKSKKESVILNQGRTFNVRRLCDKFAQLNIYEVNKIKAGLCRLYFGCPSLKEGRGNSQR